MARKTHKSPEQAREAILDAAETIIVEVGPAGLHISAVAKKAGMAHPNVLHHFGSRDGLIHSVSERIGDRATARITAAINQALSAEPEDRVSAITRVLDTSFQGDEGRAAVWMHMSGANSPVKSNMQQIVELAHQFRESLHHDADKQNTNRVVMLIALALVGEVVSGQGIKDALGFANKGESRAHFHQWLVELLINLSDQQLATSLSNKPENQS